MVMGFQWKKEQITPSNLITVIVNQPKNGCFFFLQSAKDTAAKNKTIIIDSLNDYSTKNSKCNSKLIVRIRETIEKFGMPWWPKSGPEVSQCHLKSEIAVVSHWCLILCYFNGWMSDREVRPILSRASRRKLVISNFSLVKSIFLCCVINGLGWIECKSQV